MCQLKITGNEVKQVLPQDMRKHHRVDSSESTASSRSNSFGDEKLSRSNNIQKGRNQQLLETRLAKLFKQKSWNFHKSRKYTGILIRTIIGLVRQNLNNWVQTIFYQSLLPKCRNQSLWPLLNCALKVCKSLFGSKLLTEVDSNKFNSIFSSWGFHWKK